MSQTDDPSLPQAVTSHPEAPLRLSDYPTTYALSGVKFTIMPVPGTPESVLITIDTPDGQAVIQPSAHDGIILAQFIKRAVKTARHPGGERQERRQQNFRKLKRQQNKPKQPAPEAARPIDDPLGDLPPAEDGWT